MRDDKAKLLDVLCQAFDLVVDVVQNGADGGQKEMARMIVLDCVKGERFEGTEDFDEFMKALENRLAPKMMSAEDFVLLPSE